MNYEDTFADYYPPVSYDTAEILQNYQAEVGVLNSVQMGAAAVLAAMNPYTAALYLPRWERLLGILPEQFGNYSRRVRDVLIKINATGGLSIPYFVGLAKTVGYEIRIDEPQPYRAGISRAGNRLAPEDILWVWHVHVQSDNKKIWRFRAGGSTAGSRLTDYGDAVIESVIQDLKPAHTEVRFSYEG